MDLSLYQRNYQPIDLGGQPQPQAQPQPQQQKKKKNFWLDQISTAGGVIGGVAGSFVTPIAGTAVGAGAGSALGEAIENMITGDSINKNLVKEGTLGAVFGAGPLKLLKGGAALATGKGIAGASQAALTPLRQKAGQKVIGAADDLAIKQFRLNKTQLTNLNKKLGEDPGQYIRRYGFQTVDDVTTKGIQPLQQQFDDVISNLGKIPKSQMKSQFDQVIKPLKGSVSLQEQALAKNLQTQVDEFLKKTGKTLTGKQVLEFRQLFDDGVKYSLRGTPEFNVSKGMADALRKSLQQTADKAGLATPDGKSLKEVGRELSKLRNLYEVVEPQAQLGRGNLPATLGNMLGLIGGSSAFGGPAGAAGGLLAATMANSAAGRRATSKGATALGSRLLNSGAQGQSARGIATRLGGLGAIRGLQGEDSNAQTLEDALMNQSLSNNTAAMNATDTNMNAPMNANIDVQYQNASQESSPYSRENLLMDIQRDPENADKYMEYFAMFQELYAPPELEEEKPLSAEAAKTISNANVGLQGIADFERAIQEDPSVLAKRVVPGRNALGGFIGGALGTRGADAAAQQIIDVIARLRTGAAITNDEARRFEQFIPTAADSEEVRQQKLGYLRNQFNAVATRSSAGGTDLESALLAQQGAY
jgi:hypothetical protein